MTKTTIFFFLLLSLKSFSQQKDTAYAELSFENDTIDLGEFQAYSMGKGKIKIKNTSSALLIIYDAHMTDPDFPTIPKEPLLPNQIKEIVINIDTWRKRETMYRTLTVTSNAKNSPTIIKLKFSVLGK